ncbi:carboxypeptidase-like regulatory domain-containing protein [Flavobacterium sp. WC2509]|uniref:carboxypeptidase-like regulatory domain-containing protein n=1 Tax=Flavobacterium sp. WC2509 TaxID=3461406 RepID=UPI0040440B80
MKYFILFLFLITSLNSVAQKAEAPIKISGTIISDNTGVPLVGVNIININQVTGTTTDSNGNFELPVTQSDTLHITLLGYESLRVRVTNDWIKNKKTTIQLTQKAIELDEVVINKYYLTGYLEIDSKLIPTKKDYRYSISGLGQGYEAGQYAPEAFGKVLGSIFNPADMLYNFFGKRPQQLKKLRELRKDDTVRNLLETKYDRETISLLLGVSQDEIGEILERCSYSEAFVKTATDLQIMDAISSCYEQYKILKKK